MGRRNHRIRRATGLGWLAAALLLSGCTGGHYHGSYYNSWGSYGSTCYTGASFEGGTEDLWVLGAVAGAGAVFHLLAGDPD